MLWNKLFHQLSSEAKNSNGNICHQIFGEKYNSMFEKTGLKKLEATRGALLQYILYEKVLAHNVEKHNE